MTVVVETVVVESEVVVMVVTVKDVPDMAKWGSGDRLCCSTTLGLGHNFESS